MRANTSNGLAADQHLLIQRSFRVVRPSRIGIGRSGGDREASRAHSSIAPMESAIATRAATVGGRSGLSDRGMAMTVCVS